MDFFAAQDSARTRTRTLVVLFVAAVIAIIIAVYVVVHVAVLSSGRPVDPWLFMVTAAATTALIGIGSAARTMQLRRQGGSKVAELLGGRRVAPNTTDEAERRLVNVVEEMALASGTPVPAIYVLDDESGINAFAAGYTTSDAAVAVTRGTLDRLSRDELQGVIAHEFSHILNGDMRLNIRLMGLLFGILLLAVMGRGILRGGARGHRSRKGSGQAAVLGLGFMAVGYIGVFFGRLIQAAVSRQREYLADAAAVQFTRNPDGIAGALTKIGAQGSRLESHHAQEASHLFFASGLKQSFATLFATHPPLTDRIERIDARFAALLPAQQVAAMPAEANLRGVGLAPGVAGFARGGEGVGPGIEGPGRGVDGLAPAIASASLLDSIGSPRSEHVAYANQLLHALPATVRAAAHDQRGAVALLCALLLHEEGDHVAAQHAAIRAYGGESLVQQSVALAADITPLGSAARLPLLDLLLPALRAHTPQELQAVQTTAQALVAADQRVDLFEFALLHLLGRHTSMGRGGRAASAAGTKAHQVASLRGDFESVLSAVAWAGAADAATAAHAFGAAVSALPRDLAGITLQDRAALAMQTIDRALGNVGSAAPAIRRSLLDACTHAVAHDAIVQVQEAELLRAVAEAIDCPMPPVMADMPNPAGA